MKTTLSIEESARIIELGVDPKLASKKEFVDIHPEVLKGNAEFARPWGWMPRFTLSDLFSILPKEILADEQKSDNHLYVSPLSIKWDIKHMMWEARYDYMEYFSAPELIDSLYSLLIWVITSGHLKTEKK